MIENLLYEHHNLLVEVVNRKLTRYKSIIVMLLFFEQPAFEQTIFIAFLVHQNYN